MTALFLHVGRSSPDFLRRHGLHLRLAADGGHCERPRLRQHFGLQDLVELLLRQQLLCQHQIVDAVAGDERFLRDLGGVGVADIGVERGDDADRVLDASAQMLAVGGDAVDAAFRQREAAGAQMVDALEQAVGDDRLEGVELQLAGFGGEASP